MPALSLNARPRRAVQHPMEWSALDHPTALNAIATDGSTPDGMGRVGPPGVVKSPTISNQLYFLVLFRRSWPGDTAGCGLGTDAWSGVFFTPFGVNREQSGFWNKTGNRSASGFVSAAGKGTVPVRGSHGTPPMSGTLGGQASWGLESGDRFGPCGKINAARVS